ncbi:hypothetical protein L6Q21_04245 [Sandaracinobacter sp. RS1-74]|uniref:hypothetical protein n=1 Tax=Sandaracinobacteroides sayramensis TaxID=2913411 RepID=UPI001EDA1DBD|nr:hypothetical protein [Sandaracinobacteroides sayramensis]MCG2840191.1 hypothetical protein [Sandaracinobacteroides sayramensis]
MRMFLVALTGAVMAVAPTAPLVAKSKNKTQWVYDGRAYESYEACKRAKDKSRDRAAIVGAASAGTVAAIAGGNLGETALVAGAGALTGAVIGKNAKKC